MVVPWSPSPVAASSALRHGSNSANRAARPVMNAPHDVEVIGKACGLAPGDLDTSSHPPQIASVGIGFVFARVMSRDALSRAAPRLDVFMDHLPAEAAVGIHLYCLTPEAHAHIETRMFAPLFGVPEDPATGSANAALIAYLAHLDPLTDKILAKTISQGVDMGRPSLMDAEAHKENGTVTRTIIGGHCVPVMTGAIQL